MTNSEVAQHLARTFSNIPGTEKKIAVLVIFDLEPDDKDTAAVMANGGQKLRKEVLEIAGHLICDLLEGRELGLKTFAVKEGKLEPKA